jgi:hypothetical protein
MVHSAFEFFDYAFNLIKEIFGEGRTLASTIFVSHVATWKRDSTSTSAAEVVGLHLGDDTNSISSFTSSRRFFSNIEQHFCMGRGNCSV